jgi:hypothetical protein
MDIADHMEGFSREAAFSCLLAELLDRDPNMRAAALYRALSQIAPEFTEELFARRRCRREVRYIGCTWDPDAPPTDDEYFKLGEKYIALSFNGGTYEIQGYSGELIGCAYFQLISDPECAPGPQAVF